MLSFWTTEGKNGETIEHKASSTCGSNDRDLDAIHEFWLVKEDFGFTPMPCDCIACIAAEWEDKETKRQNMKALDALARKAIKATKEDKPDRARRLFGFCRIMSVALRCGRRSVSFLDFVQGTSGDFETVAEDYGVHCSKNEKDRKKNFPANIDALTIIARKAIKATKEGKPFRAARLFGWCGWLAGYMHYGS